MMLFVPNYSLIKPLRLSQNSCICTVIRLHTGLYLFISSTFDHSAIIKQFLKAIGCTQKKRGLYTFAHRTYQFFIVKKKLKSCIICFVLHNCTIGTIVPLRVGLSHEISIKYIYVCSRNVTKCRKFNGYEYFCKPL